ncbi:coatomer subunit beta-2-like [Lolium perenne]|uniref:coatomer subunit beta-2-like n=1 Tax=Lolium perenne TaxID=4522 RepID=UPI0021F631B4|nr:coatomer subunit beta-2-like [Lolium perenne]
MDKPCTLMIHFEKGSAAMANVINSDLEGSDVAAKTEAMKRAVMLLLNGETLPKLFLTVVRYVLPSEDHTVQKLLLLYLEIIDKRDPAGRVLPEMILVCQKLRHNLRHPNEYIRGVTLRFLCCLSEPEILEPLVPSILENLDHRHHFVRRHALSAISAIYRLPHGDQLISDDAPELVERAVASEQDASARRNAFLVLCLCAQERALVHLFSNAQRVTQWPDLLQMAAVELIRKVCSCPNRADKGRYIKIIVSLLSSPSTAVVYECAGALASLSSAPTDARAAANTYNKLLSSQSDNNVRLILLDRLNELRRSHRHVMVDVVNDVLRALAIPNLDVKSKVLDLVLGLLTPRNVKEVVLYLKKEAGKTKSGEYRRMLLQAIHECAVEVPKVAGSVGHLLMDFLGGTNAAAAVDVVLFVREIIATTTDAKLRASMIRRLSDTFYRIRASRVCSIALSILGEYSLSLAEVERAISTIRQCLGDPPFSTVSTDGETTDPSKPAQPMVNSVTLSSRRPVVPADGTLSAANEAISTPSVTPVSSASTLNLRSLILSGDFCLAAVVASTLTKLVLRLQELQPSKAEAKKACTGALLVMTSILQLQSSS